MLITLVWFIIINARFFVEIRKRVDKDIYDSLNVKLIKSVSEKNDEKQNNKSEKDNDNTPPNKGKLQAVASVQVTVPATVTSP